MTTNISCYSCGEPLHDDNISATRIVTIDGQQLDSWEEEILPLKEQLIA